jgi:hypothetical protein
VVVLAQHQRSTLQGPQYSMSVMQQQAAAYLDTCHWLSNITTEALTQTCFINITTNC